MRTSDRVLQVSGVVLLVVAATLLVLTPDFFRVLGSLIGGNGASLPILLGFLGLLLLLAGWWRGRRSEMASYRLPAVVTIAALAAFAWAWSRQHQGLITTPVRFVSDGDQLAGTITRPAVAGRHPGIVIAPGSLPAPHRIYAVFAAGLSRLGFVVLSFDRRGVGKSGGGDKLDENNNGGAPYLIQLGRDLAAGARTLRSTSHVDPERVGFVGISQGGWVIPLAVREDTLAAFALIMSGPTTSTSEEEVFSRLTDEQSDHFGRRPPPQPLDVINAIVDTASPGSFDPRPVLGELTIPIRWLFGEWDNSIPVAKSVRIVDSLAGVGKPYRAIVFPEGNHGLMIARGPRARLLPYWDRAVWDTTSAWLRAISGTR